MLTRTTQLDGLEITITLRRSDKRQSTQILSLPPTVQGYSSKQSLRQVAHSANLKNTEQRLLWSQRWNQSGMPQRRRWQRGQKVEDRPANGMRRISVPQRGQGSPPRP